MHTHTHSCALCMLTHSVHISSSVREGGGGGIWKGGEGRGEGEKRGRRECKKSTAKAKLCWVRPFLPAPDEEEEVVVEEEENLHRFFSFFVTSYECSRAQHRTREPSRYSPLGLVSHRDTSCVRGNSHHGNYRCQYVLSIVRPRGTLGMSQDRPCAETECLEVGDPRPATVFI